MAVFSIPHFHNEPGVPAITIGARRFMCIGAKPPFDHPHVFIDMGADDEAICSYCGTLYKYNAGFAASVAEPAECLWTDSTEAA